LVGLQGLVLAVWGVLVLTKVSGTTIGLSILFFVCAAALGLCTYGLVRLRSWSRAPIVLAQLITLGLAWDYRSNNTPVAIGLLVFAGVTLACVLNPTSLESLSSED
jgi:hypothetical protein